MEGLFGFSVVSVESFLRVPLTGTRCLFGFPVAGMEIVLDPEQKLIFENARTENSPAHILRLILWVFNVSIASKLAQLELRVKQKK
jgi:hypothetical protein